jgi:hypothetical protein
VTGADDRIARLHKLAEVMLGTEVRSLEPLPGRGLDVFLVQRQDAHRVRALWEGELRLRVLAHGWRLETAACVLAGGLDPREALEEVLDVLVGRSVSTVRIARPGLDTMIGFGNLRLRVFPVSTLPMPGGVPAWTLRTAQGVWLVVGPGEQWGMAGRTRTGGGEGQVE